MSTLRSDEASGAPHYMRAGLSMRVGHDVTGYPCFYINGMSGEQKRDDAMLASHTRLFQAAPELLAAAKRALNFIANTEGEHGITLDSGDALRAAIAKAEGSK